MDLIADRGRRVTVEELNTSQLLAHARKQAVQRKLDDMMIVDVDAHHYENEHFGEILPFMENDVLRQLAMSGRASTRARPNLTPQTVGFQDMGGRVTRYPLRGTEKTPGAGGERAVACGQSCGVRTRNVAKLDRTLTSVRQPRTYWDQERLHGPYC